MARTLAMVLSVVAVSGCGVGEAGPMGVVSYDDAPLFAALATYKEQGFVKVTRAPFHSAVADAYIEIWVSAEAATAYETLTPEDSVSNVKLPVGTQIIRDVQDANGKLTKIAMISQAPAGYNPDVNDFWFGVADPDGAAQVVDGIRQAGALSTCASCHIERADQSYLFGVDPNAMTLGEH